MKEALVLEVGEVARLRGLLRHDLEAWGINPCASLVVSLPAKGEGKLDGQSGDQNLIADAPAVDLLAIVARAEKLEMDLCTAKGLADGAQKTADATAQRLLAAEKTAERLAVDLVAADQRIKKLERELASPKPPTQKPRATPTRGGIKAVFVRDSEAHLDAVDRGKRLATTRGRRIFYIWFCPGDGAIVPSFGHTHECDPDLIGGHVVERWELSAGGSWDSRPLDRDVAPVYATNAREAVRLG